MPIAPPPHVAQLRLESERRLALWATTLLLIPGVLFAYVDISLASDRTTLYVLHALRASQLLLWALGVVGIRRAPSRDALAQLLFLLALGIVAFLTANALMRPADNWMPVRTMVLVSIGTFIVYPYPFRRQLVAWAALLLAVTGLIWGHWVTMPTHERVATGLNIVLAGVLGMLIAGNRAQLDRDLDASLEREREANAERERATAALRRLEGIIPICAYCHQVRTEAGAWEQLDQYVRRRTDADFSHGMCPACATQHFPDLADSAAETPRPTAE